MGSFVDSGFLLLHMGSRYQPEKYKHKEKERWKKKKRRGEKLNTSSKRIELSPRGLRTNLNLPLSPKDASRSCCMLASMSNLFKEDTCKIK